MLTGTTSVIDTERQNGRSAIPSLTGEKPTLSGHHRNGGFDPERKSPSLIRSPDRPVRAATAA
jgi:hypothetical protein